MSLPLLGVELLDQREDVAMILRQQLPEVLAARRLGLLLGDGATGHELLVDLIVQLVAVGDDDEGPVAGQRAQDLLREEQHRETLAAALGVPEHAEPPALFLQLANRVDRAVDAEILVVLGDDLGEVALQLLEGGEVLDEVEQARGRAGAADHGFQRDDPGLAFVVDTLPLGEMFPAGRAAADAALAAVRENVDGVVPEEVRNGRLVVSQVVGEGVLQALVAGLKLDEHERNAVDEPDEITASLVHLAGDPQLRGKKEVVLGGFAPVDDADRFRALAAVVGADLHLHAVLQQVVDLAVGVGGAHRRAVACQLFDGK